MRRSIAALIGLAFLSLLLPATAPAQVTTLVSFEVGGNAVTVTGALPNVPVTVKIFKPDGRLKARQTKMADSVGNVSFILTDWLRRAIYVGIVPQNTVEVTQEGLPGSPLTHVVPNLRITSISVGEDVVRGSLQPAVVPNVNVAVGRLLRPSPPAKDAVVQDDGTFEADFTDDGGFRHNDVLGLGYLLGSFQVSYRGFVPGLIALKGTEIAFFTGRSPMITEAQLRRRPDGPVFARAAGQPAPWLNVGMLLFNRGDLKAQIDDGNVIDVQGWGTDYSVAMDDLDIAVERLPATTETVVTATTTPRRIVLLLVTYLTPTDSTSITIAAGQSDVTTGEYSISIPFTTAKRVLSVLAVTQKASGHVIMQQHGNFPLDEFFGGVLGLSKR